MLLQLYRPSIHSTEYKLSLKEIENEICKVENIEKYIAVKNGNIEKHVKKWRKHEYKT